MREHDYKKTMMTVMVAATSLFTATAQIPTGYYDLLNGKKGSELKSAVHETIKDANVLDYGSGSGKTWDGFYSTDRADDNQVIDRYSNDIRYFTTEGTAVSGMNIEHSFPKSWWGGSKNQAYCDLFNLMPCESNINSKKSNYPMGEVTTDKQGNGCTKVGTGSNGYQLWEPADKWKGDFARGYMYMATAYQDLTWSGTQALQILENDTWPTLQEWAYTLYISWAKTDAVDATEVKRNEAVYQIQGNRNPYVDFPNLMEYVWGDSIDYAFNTATTMKSSDYISGGTVVPTEETIYSATFTSTDGDFTADNTTVWTRSSKYGWTGTAYINKKATAADAILTSPEIDLTAYIESSLQFSHAVNFASSPSDVLSVEIVCDGETTVVNDLISWPAGNSWTFKESGAINLSAFAGKRIRIVFHYTSTSSEACTWEIKNLSVKGKHDSGGLTEISMPTQPDPAQPYDIYTIDGRKANPTAHGLLIIRQNGKTWKVVR